MHTKKHVKWGSVTCMHTLWGLGILSKYASMGCYSSCTCIDKYDTMASQAIQPDICIRVSRLPCFDDVNWSAFIKLANRNAGQGKPEMRVPALIFGSLFVPVGLLWDWLYFFLSIWSMLGGMAGQLKLTSTSWCQSLVPLYLDSGWWQLCGCSHLLAPFITDLL
jgi:hypothetical protein